MINNILRKISTSEYSIDIDKMLCGEDKEQFLINCLLSECSFTATFDAFGDPYLSFTEESKWLVDNLNINIDIKQLHQLHWAIGVLPSSMLYFDKVKNLDKKYGDKIINGLIEGFGYIDHKVVSKYNFLASISNYSTGGEVFKALVKDCEDDWIDVFNMVNEIVDLNLNLYEGWKTKMFINRDKIRFGIDKFMHGSFFVSIQKDNDDFIVEFTKNERPNDSYGREIKNDTSILKKDVLKNKRELNEILLTHMLTMLHAAK